VIVLGFAGVVVGLVMVAGGGYGLLRAWTIRRYGYPQIRRRRRSS
jgi:hypothetical protein